MARRAYSASIARAPNIRFLRSTPTYRRTCILGLDAARTETSTSIESHRQSGDERFAPWSVFRAEERARCRGFSLR